MTQDHYVGRRIARTGAAELLEAIDRRMVGVMETMGRPWIRGRNQDE